MDQVIGLVQQIGNLGELRGDEDFYDAGFSSLGSLQLLLELESAFGVAIPDDEFINARTIDALHQLIARLKETPQSCA